MCPLMDSSEIDCQALSLPHARATVTGSSDTVCLCLPSVCLPQGVFIAHPLATQPSYRGQGHAAAAATCRVAGHATLDAIGTVAEVADCLVLVVQCHGRLFELRLVYRVRGQRLAPLCQCLRCP